MKHRSWRALGCSMGFALLWAGASCTQENTGLFIQGNILRNAPDCIARPEASTTLIGIGTLDVGVRLEYDASLLVGSQLTPRADKTNLRTETMVTTIEGAEVHLYRDTGELDTEFTVPASGVIQPNQSVDPGFGIVNATLIPQDSGLELVDEIQNRGQTVTRVAEVKVYGRTIGGLDVESSTFRYVIQVCKGCLIDFPPTAFDGKQCNSGGDQNPTPPCRPGQDDALDCRLCLGNPYCDSPAEP